MFPDWVTVSFGKIEQYQVRGALFEHIRILQKAYPRAYTCSTFGALSICFPGKHWQSVDEASGMTLMDDVLHWCATAHVSRFDLAHDWNLNAVDADPIWRAVDTCGIVLDKLIGHDGVTWYGGSRESGWFLRLYQKDKEILAKTGVDVGFPILRLEVEFKREQAPEFFAHWRRAPDVVQDNIARHYGLEKFLLGSSTDVIRVHGLPPVDPFAFVRRFQKVISYARAVDPRLFDELIPEGRRDTA
jgi:hypothetical protein